MSFNLKEFPEQLPVRMKDKRGRRLNTKLKRDKARLLVAFRKASTRQEVETLVGKVGLRLEDAGEHEIREEIARMVEVSCDDLKKRPDKKKEFSDKMQAIAKKRATENKCGVPDLSRRVTHTASR